LSSPSLSLDNPQQDLSVWCLQGLVNSPNRFNPDSLLQNLSV
jgi:hypothetical protein